MMTFQCEIYRKDDGNCVEDGRWLSNTGGDTVRVEQVPETQQEPSRNMYWHAKLGSDVYNPQYIHIQYM